MGPEVFSRTLERITSQFYDIFKEIKSYTVLKAIKSVVNHTDIQFYRANVL